MLTRYTLRGKYGPLGPFLRLTLIQLGMWSLPVFGQLNRRKQPTLFESVEASFRACSKASPVHPSKMDKALRCRGQSWDRKKSLAGGLGSSTVKRLVEAALISTYCIYLRCRWFSNLFWIRMIVAKGTNEESTKLVCTTSNAPGFMLTKREDGTVLDPCEGEESWLSRIRWFSDPLPEHCRSAEMWKTRAPQKGAIKANRFFSGRSQQRLKLWIWGGFGRKNWTCFTGVPKSVDGSSGRENSGSHLWAWQKKNLGGQWKDCFA